MYTLDWVAHMMTGEDYAPHPDALAPFLKRLLLAKPTPQENP